MAVQPESDDRPTAELMAAHEAVRNALLVMQTAVGNCAACYARELRYVAEAVAQLAEDAEEIAVEDHGGRLH
jgi:hypothetical protein